MKCAYCEKPKANGPDGAYASDVRGFKPIRDDVWCCDWLCALSMRVSEEAMADVEWMMERMKTLAERITAVERGLQSEIDWRNWRA